ncbi:cell division protein ZapE [Massilia sp. W12]|uniref:cell division protein ZapE n=1 Tax=Massilia sp. W12 TaxID=3126507 RepID=UPI0030D21D02
MNVTEYYQDALARRAYQADPAQLAAVARLQQAFDEWTAYKARRSNSITRLLVRPPLPRGVYLWGGVGRGKSFLMDSFYSVLPLVRKTRLHFHEFMRGVHRQLDELKGQPDPLKEVAKRVARKYRMICFDEFHVSDVADAMIMYNLLSALFEHGVCFVMTSNYRPDDLYPDGLHRDRMLPTIALLKEKMDVVNVDAGIDYRKRVLEQVAAYYTPLGPQADAALTHAFDEIAEVADAKPDIEILGRKLRARRRAGSIIWFDFATLCESARSQNDYLELASLYHTIIVSGVPEMTPAQESAARRFTWLIDVLYDCKVKLLLSAAVAPERLYVQGAMANEFQRTVSRIIEMQSAEYMATQQRLVAQNLV